MGLDLGAGVIAEDVTQKVRLNPWQSDPLLPSQLYILLRFAE